MRNAIYRILQGIILLAVASSFAQADDFMYFKKKAAGGGGAAPPTYLASESFDNSVGYDRAWTVVGGTPDPDYTDNVLEGTQSLEMAVKTDAETKELYTAFTPTDGQAQEIYFLIKYPYIGTTTTDYTVFDLKDAGGNNVSRAYVSRGGGTAKFKITSVGGTAGTTVGTITDNVVYHVWIRYLKGGGADAFSSIAFSTDGVRPASGNNYAESTNGTSTANATRLQLRLTYGAPTSSCDAIFDKIRVDDATIGDNPS
ncbi:hypothetical protein M0Q28_05785 [Patescibacteria group bacterium]|jgi:hypothetical protein|nr:hypothetical protein [Patescibacteria group bacterium]